MDIFKYAINLETEGEKFYRELAEKTNHTGIKNIMNMLADDELKHKKIFENLKNDYKVVYAPTEILSKAKSIFKGIKAEDFLNSSKELAIYEKALEFEQKSINIYKEELNKQEDIIPIELLLELIEEEKKHYNLVDNIIKLLKRPEEWVESAEFNHLEKY